jgi:hypothetical protein
MNETITLAKEETQCTGLEFFGERTPANRGFPVKSAVIISIQ